MSDLFWWKYAIDKVHPLGTLLLKKAGIGEGWIIKEERKKKRQNDDENKLHVDTVCHN